MAPIPELGDAYPYREQTASHHEKKLSIVGSYAGGQRAAIIYTLADSHPINRIDELLLGTSRQTINLPEWANRLQAPNTVMQDLARPKGCPWAFPAAPRVGSSSGLPNTLELVPPMH